MGLIKIFNGKEPWMHLFFVDYEKKVFYKMYLDKYKQYFDKEVEIYTKLSDTGLTPKLYDHFTYGCYHILKLELLPYKPVIGFGKSDADNEVGYSPAQKQSIIKQLNNFCDIIQERGMADKNGCFDFEITHNNMLYSATQDKVYFYDFAYKPPRETLNFIRSFIPSNIIPLPDTNVPLIGKSSLLGKF